MTTRVAGIVPESPEDLGLTGFPEWREHQREIVQEIVYAFLSSERVLLDAPTGSGKTIVGAAVARMLGGGALYNSHTIMLQDQQLHTLPSAVTVTGKRNHACLGMRAKSDVFPSWADATADDCDECDRADCSYREQLRAAGGSRDVVLNYAYAIRVLKAPYNPEHPTPFQYRSLIVCDEGHNLESALLDADGVDVYVRSWESFGLRVPNSVDPQTWFEALPDLWDDALDAVREAHANDRSLSMKRKIRGLLAALEGIRELAGASIDTPIYIGRTDYGYRFRPLWAWHRAHQLLYRHSPNTLVMSATLGEPDLAARVLGLRNWEHLAIPSTFPVANRPVLYWPVAKMKHGMSESEKVRQIGALVHIARRFPGSPGVVHAGSFALSNYLVAGVRASAPDVAERLLSHDSKSRDGTFKTFESFATNEILVTPSASTGVDWDHVGWQVIPKVPYPDLSDEFTRLRYDYVTEDGEKLGQQVYTQEAVKTLVQAAGRCVRTPTSKGVTFVTDGNFWSLYKYQAPKAFPDWFRQAVSWYKPPTAQ